MKRVLIAIAIVLVVLVATIGMLFAPLLIGTNPIPEDMEINGVRFIKDGFVLVNIIDAGEGDIVLIDAGMDTSGAPIIDALSQRGLGPEAVKAILITHGHFDHIRSSHRGISECPGDGPRRGDRLNKGHSLRGSLSNRTSGSREANGDRGRSHPERRRNSTDRRCRDPDLCYSRAHRW